jgi:Xaa-Pro aminopeptidase
VWFRATAIGSARGVIARANNAALIRQTWNLRLTSSTTLNLAVVPVTGITQTANIVAGGSLLTGDWHHVVGQWRNAPTSGLDIWLFLDDLTGSTLAGGTTGLDTATPGQIGLQYQKSTANTELIGGLHDIRWERRLWSPDEIAAMRQLGPQSRAALPTADAWLPSPMDGQVIGSTTWALTGTGTDPTRVPVSHPQMRAPVAP